MIDTLTLIQAGSLFASYTYVMAVPFQGAVAAAVALVAGKYLSAPSGSAKMIGQLAVFFPAAAAFLLVGAQGASLPAQVRDFSALFGAQVLTLSYGAPLVYELYGRLMSTQRTRSPAQASVPTAARASQ